MVSIDVLDRKPYEFPRTERLTVRDCETGRDYSIFVSKPIRPPSAAGYPVVYLFDANAMMGTLIEALTLQSYRPGKAGVRPAIVVGIGYPGDAPLNPERRTLDYTPPVEAGRLSEKPDGSAWTQTGGAPAFLDFMEKGLIPHIEVTLPVERSCRVLVGHSFGGLLGLFALFTRPHLFQRTVASSPSIWFGDRVILNHEDQFFERARREGLSNRLYIGVGGLEQTPPVITDEASGRRARWVLSNRMVDNASELATRLKGLSGNGLDVAFDVYPDESHISVIPSVLSRALRYALAAT